MKNIVICFDIFRDFALEWRMTNSLKLFSTLIANDTQRIFYIPVPPLGTGAKGIGEAAIKLAEAAIKLEPVGIVAALISPMSKMGGFEAIKNYAFGDAFSKQMLAAIHRK